MTETNRTERLDRRLELAAMLLLAVAAVATAWCSYQATRWNGQQTKQSGTTNRLRLEAGRAQGLAEAQTQVDLATFVQWVDGYTLDRPELQKFYLQRFRDEFKPAFQAWLATHPLTNLNAPRSPFAMPQYKLAATTEAKQLESETDPLSITIRADGTVYVQETVVPKDDLIAQMRAISREGYDRRVFIRADAAAEYGLVADVMARLSASGFRNLGLVTNTRDQAAQRPTPEEEE